MSRVNANSEPSMEEILASIRKIIAEDPPGSRLAPASRAAAAVPPPPASDRSGFMSRDAFLKPNTPPASQPSAQTKPASSSASAAAAAAERALNAPRPVSPAPQMRGGMLPPAGTDRDDASPRPELRLPPRPSDVDAERPSLRPSANPAVSSSNAASRASQPSDIDDQLSDLLDDAPAISKSAAPSQPLVSESAPAARPGMQVSRIGFDGGDTGIPEGGIDPFEFDLGPSPFATPPAASEAPSEDPQQSTAPSAKDDVIAAARDALNSSVLVAQAVVKESLAQHMPRHVAFDEPRKPEPAPQPAAPAAEVPRPVAAPVEAAPERTNFEPPSIAATIGPIRKLAPYPDILTPSPAASSRPEPPPAAPMPAVSAEPPRAHTRKTDSETVLFEGTGGALTPAPFSMAMTDLDNRSMEDTVADLLRPMLKSWLAENMPRIIERALRREMLERSNHGQKSAAE